MMTRPKNVLVIANVHHAFPRVLAWGAYLPEVGWNATILTPPAALQQLGCSARFGANARLVEAAYRGDVFWLWRRLFAAMGFRTTESVTEQVKVRLGVSQRSSWVDKLLHAYQTVFAYPDTERTWRRPALRAAARLLEQERFDALMSSSPFPTVHLIAAEVKRRTGLPWCADFRDSWTQNHCYAYGSARRRLEERFEHRTLASADALTAAAPIQARDQENFHRRPVTVITNGFDPDDVNEPPAPLTKTFTLTYTGTVYAGKQEPSRILTALQRLVADGTIAPGDVEMRFYGTRLGWLDHEIETLGLKEIAVQYGPTSRREALERQRESHVLLLFNWEDPTQRGVYPLKLFEYMASRRPILASGGFPGDDVATVLRETAAGVYAPIVADIQAHLANFYREFRESGHVREAGHPKRVDAYSNRRLARRFADILDRLVEA